jgi:tetratricopeptide (TPR) repeat protein
VNRVLTTIALVLKVVGAAFVIVNLSAMGTAMAQDRTWNECELAEHDPERSIAACSRLLGRPSTRLHAAAFHNRGLAWAAKENLDQAVSDISQGIRLDPQRPYRWQERGEIYSRQGKYPQAITDITEAIRLDPIPRAFRFHSRAEAYRGLGDLTRAIADFDEAIRLDPVGRSFRFHDRGNALRDAGQHDRALVDYETAAKLAPTDAWILLDRGRTYKRMGRFDAEKNDFDTAIALDPSNAELRRYIEVELAGPSSIPPSSVPPLQPTPGARPGPGKPVPGLSEQHPPKPTPTEPPKTANAIPINLPSAMIGGWCYNEGTEARQVYIRNDGVCVGTEGVLTIWPDSYGGSGGTCTLNKIDKLAMNGYLVKSSCKGLPKGQYDGLTWTENVELRITNGHLTIIPVP